MSIRVMSWVLDYSDAPGNDRLVLIAIADEADDDGTNAYPSIDRIARRARVNKRTTMRSLERLEASGELVIVHPATSGRGHHNRYGVVMGRDPDAVRDLVAHPGKGDNLSAEKGAERRGKARKGAPMSALDPLTPRPADSTATTSRAPSLVSDAFTDFWREYPRKIAKPAAQRAWRRVIDPERVMAGLAKWAAYWQVRNEPQFIPHPATWLNDERWNDEPPAVTQRAQPKGPGWSPSPEEDAAARARPSGRIVDL